MKPTSLTQAFANAIRLYWPLGAITFVGAWFSLHSICDYWINGDEGLWWFICQETLKGFFDKLHSVPHPPLYYILLWLVSRINNEVLALRFVSAFFGILSIPAIYFLGKEFADRRVGLQSAFMLAISPVVIIQSQVIRQYTCFLLLTILALLGLLRLCHGKRIGLSLYIVSSVFGVLIHYGFLLVISANFFVGMVLLLRKSDRVLLRRFILIHAFPALCCLVIALSLFPLNQALIWTEVLENSWLSTYLNRDMYRIALSFVMMFVYFFGPYLSWVILVLTLSAYLILLKNRKYKELFFLFFPILIFIGASILHKYPFGGSRHLIPLLPLVILGAGMSFSWMSLTRCSMVLLAAIGVTFTTLTLEPKSTLEVMDSLKISLTRDDWVPPLSLRLNEQQLPWKKAMQVAQNLRDYSASGKIIALTACSFYTFKPVLRLRCSNRNFCSMNYRPVVVFHGRDPHEVSWVLRDVLQNQVNLARVHSPRTGAVLLIGYWGYKVFDGFFPIPNPYVRMIETMPGFELRHIGPRFFDRKL